MLKGTKTPGPFLASFGRTSGMVASLTSLPKKWPPFLAMTVRRTSTAPVKKRYCGDYNKLPSKVGELIDFCYSQPFIKYLEELTGEQDLKADPYLEGGGIHSIAPGGFLKIHTDYNWHERLSMYRRLNLLVYLNREWQENWGGALELWDSDVTRCVKMIYPEYNTSVLFTTDDSSFPGHPEKLACPEDVRRNRSRCTTSVLRYRR